MVDVKMSVPFIDLLPQHKAIRAEVLKALSGIADSQKFIMDAQGRRFEEKIARYLGVRHAVGVGSGSDALYLSLAALGMGAGDEVITTPFSFFSTAGSISRTGARPVFADIDARTFNIDPKEIRKKISKRTKAILPVHLFGLVCDMDAIRSIGSARSLPIVEDAAQSFGAEYKGKKAGAIGTIGCFSFYPTKNLGGAGDGGMMVTASKKLADKIRILRDHGQTKKYHHEWVGLNSRLDELQAAWLLVKLKHIDRWNAARRRHAAEYDKAFRGLPLETPCVPKGRVSNYHLYSIQTERRDELADHLDKQGIGNGVYYPRGLHLQPCYRSLGYRKGDFPVTEHVTEHILSLPMYAEMSAAQRNAVIRGVRSFFR